MEKIQELVKKMSRKTIEEYCNRKPWRLPTYEEAKEIDKIIDHDYFWIEGEEYSEDPDTKEGEMRPLAYSNGKKFTVNKNFMLNVVVFEKEKVCICEICKKEMKE